VIDIVGHFGSLYSYASVAGNVCEALKESGLLGAVVNLDSSWHPRWHPLKSQGAEMGGSHVIVFSVPHHYLDAFISSKNRENAAIFISPNTDSMDDEYLQTVGKFGTVFAPSRYCLEPVMGVDDIVCSVLPLGCPVRHDRPGKATSSETLRDKTRVVHFTSDQAWPGRKGTEELVRAWNKLRPDASMVIHGPASLQKNMLYMLADFDLTDEIEYMVSDRHGEPDEALEKLYDSADLIVAPSRAEGFGMMISGAIVAGIPLLTTCNTGHAEFLLKWPGRWLGVPSPYLGPLAFEGGRAPQIDEDVLAAHLDIALMDDVRASMLSKAAQDAEAQGDWGTWQWAKKKWMDRLSKWSGGE